MFVCTRQAEMYYQECLRIRETKCGTHDLNTLATMSDLGNVYLAQKNWESAAKLLNQCYQGVSIYVHINCVYCNLV